MRIMTDHEGNVDDRELALALRRLGDAVVVPDPDPARRTALMAAFDEAQRRRPAVHSGRQYWYMAGLATAAGGLDGGRPASGPDWTSRFPSRCGSANAHASRVDLP
jgi:hypothetical protein